MRHSPSENVFRERLFEYRSTEKKKLILSLSITFIVMIVELAGGLWTHSIALISDAGHMFTHCFAIGISLIAIIIALIGLVTNITSILILHGSHEEDLNVRSVFFHMIADAASSIGIIVAAVLILYTGWNVLDPIVSIGISAAIVYWAWGILRESTIILLEMAPTGLNVDMISDELKASFPEIKKLINPHLWAITADMLVFSAHVILKEMERSLEEHVQIIEKINVHLSNRFHVIESTIQIVSEDENVGCT